MESQLYMVVWRAMTFTEVEVKLDEKPAMMNPKVNGWEQHHFVNVSPWTFEVPWYLTKFRSFVSVHQNVFTKSSDFE